MEYSITRQYVCCSDDGETVTRLMLRFEDAVGWLFAWRRHRKIAEVNAYVIPREWGRSVMFESDGVTAVIHPVTVRVTDGAWWP